MEIFETKLPGVGIRYEFESAAGPTIGVIAHRDGRREIIRYDEVDPDACSISLPLTDRELVAMIELLGGSKVTERLGELRHEVQGLSIEWVTMPELGGLTDRTIEDGMIRTRTGASVVAVLRGSESFPGPGPDFRFVGGDVALVVGSVEGVRSAARLLAE